MKLLDRRQLQSGVAAGITMRVFTMICLHVIACNGYDTQGAAVSVNMSGILTRVFSTYSQQMTLNVIFDEVNVESILRYKHDRPRTMMFSYHHVSTVLVPVMEKVMKHASLEQMRDQLQFLVVCELRCVEQLFTEVTQLDLVVGQGSLLRHFSTWLIVSPDDPHPMNVRLDNAAWIHFQKQLPLGSAVLENIKGVYTLLWVPGQREWLKIDVGDFQHVRSFNTLFPNLERGLNGRELVLTTLEWGVHAVRHILNGKVTYTGVSMETVDMLKRTFNFSYIIIEPNDNLWGNELENGTFTGVLGMLQRKKSHFCPVPYTMALRRMRIVDYSSPLYTNEYTLVYRWNSNRIISWFSLTSGYSWPVYLCGTGSLLWVVLWMFCLGFSKSNGLRHGRRHTDWHFEIIFRVPFRQDILLSTNKMSSRIMVFTWALFCLLFAAVYTSNIVAVSTTAKEKLPFTNLEDFAQQTNYMALLDEGSFVEGMLKETNNSILQAVRARTIKLPTSPEDSFEDRVDIILEQLSSGAYAAIASYGLDRILISRDCDIFKTQTFFHRYTGIPFPKHSPLMKLFNEKLLTIKEMGVIDKMVSEAWPKAKECDRLIHRPKVTVNHLKSGLVVVCCGILIAVVVLLIEIQRQKVVVV